VLSDGRVMVTRSRAPKSSVGYNLHQLLIGSEGTLAIVTELVLVIRPLPAAVLAARAQFPSTHHVTDFVSALIQAGVTQLARAELLNGIMMRAVNRYSNTAFPEAPTLFLEFHGTTKAVRLEISFLIILLFRCSFFCLLFLTTAATSTHRSHYRR
jgi:D-lactate dehydrogenase (cytochrome)